ncbi:MAG TPA: peptidase T [Anaerolineae bacterium]|nr:peptidase T [Anaerolineae bacterium]HNU05065.1 peptidase T [Anaerolineae bacterium]
MHDKYLAELEERFVRYVQIDTMADDTSPTSPSTAKQYDLIHLLAEELAEIGAQEIRVTDYGALLATIPGRGPKAASAPTVAFLAHVDTIPGFSGAGVKPQVHRNYAGGSLTFPDAPELTLSPETSPNLAKKIGYDIVTGSGATILGADDKCGVAIVMAMANELLHNSASEHGPVRVCFTPDEEIGRGVDPQLPADLAVDVAYTLDGGEPGAIVYETFSADKAVVTIDGVSTHTGTAKEKMVNALTLAAKVLGVLPQATLTPETADGRAGFIHCYKVVGNAAHVEIAFILRDFTLEGLRANGEVVEKACQVVAAGEPRAKITCTITPQYRNMYYWLAEDMRPVELARAAYRDLGLEPFDEPIRGGTDGSRLTELGTPTPNLFTGMNDVHGPLEWVSLQDMALATAACVRLAELWGQETR